MRMMLAAAAVLVSTTALGGSMWQCEDYVLTDRPWDYDGCTEVGSGRAYGEEATPKPRQAPTRARSTAGGRWFEGGTLHHASVGDWLRASRRDKVATCGDWLSATTWKGHLNTPADFDRLHGQARLLAAGVDEVVDGDAQQVPGLQVREIAAALIKLSRDFRPY